MTAPFTTYVASHDGQSLRIAARILARLGLPEDGFIRLGPNLPALDAETPILLVAAVRYGKHLAEAEALLKAYAAMPARPPLALVSVNLTARKPDKKTAEQSAYLKKAIATHGLQPVAARAIAGKLDYPRYKWTDRQLIRFIMWVTGGPTKGTEVIEYTDWAEVDAFADGLRTAFSPAAPKPAA
jgi:menaquinone-dependent protoporphyrinogen oxidase